MANSLSSAGSTAPAVIHRRNLFERTVGRLALGVIHALAHLLCRIDDAEMARIPATGPLILFANHINFLDVPIFFVHLVPRPVTALSKVENMRLLVLGGLFNLFGAIPIRRGEADLGALRKGLEALKAGQILALAPEGTRSHDGRLQRGQAGLVTLALKSEAPLLPMVCYGSETFRANFKRLRRTPFHIRVGKPFYLQADGPITHEARQRMTDEIMYQLAALLPPENRGVYADLAAATEEYLRFPPGSESNLARARGG